ncbi:DUF6688 family protein [Niabella yanshanensis]|uniref:DUF6688 family protein n=1 Tax=Niabella yanshanensis TaxID=577386 RepID=A0ABZ0WAF8_9BACT|nr:DUF6688 family protein [Niabella yanshanensis]WQD38965.1 DUF6688 family protein [Niabella yanshanensis]
MVDTLIFGTIALIISTLIALTLLKKQFPHITGGAIIILVLYIALSALFVLGMMIHDRPYIQAIDPIDNCYSPFGDQHTLSLLAFFLLYHVALFFIWVKGRQMPPLTLVLMLAMLFMGSIVNVLVIVQVGSHDTGSIDRYKGNDGTALLLPAPLLNLLISILLITNVVNEERRLARQRTFKNSFLRYCNSLLAGSYHEATWALLLLLPVWFIITLILILLGQDFNSLVKVFTDTTTWTFSQKMHPPPLDHRGHYLCTVAARGNPKLVKPLRVGIRHGQPAIVNRQLMIANAFEEYIQAIAPAFHQSIRQFYDRYGYNLSQKINSVKASNFTYIVMKPLEWTFLLSLYLFCINPEARIQKQYR